MQLKTPLLVELQFANPQTVGVQLKSGIDDHWERARAAVGVILPDPVPLQPSRRLPFSVNAVRIVAGPRYEEDNP